MVVMVLDAFWRFERVAGEACGGVFGCFLGLILGAFLLLSTWELVLFSVGLYGFLYLEFFHIRHEK